MLRAIWCRFFLRAVSVRTTIPGVLLAAFLLLPAVQVSAAVTGVTGGSQPFSNVQPSLGVNAFMPLQGIYPSQKGAAMTKCSWARCACLAAILDRAVRRSLRDN